MVTVKRETTSNQATDTDTNSHRITMAEISSNQSFKEDYQEEWRCVQHLLGGLKPRLPYLFLLFHSISFIINKYYCLKHILNINIEQNKTMKAQCYKYTENVLQDVSIYGWLYNVQSYVYILYMMIIPSLFSAFSYEAPVDIKDIKSFYFKYEFFHLKISGSPGSLQMYLWP